MVRLLSDAVASVIVMRHCLRSCPDVAKGGAPGFDWLANYTSPSHPMQPFEVAEYQCLPNGIALVEGIGRQLAGTVPGPVVVEADSAAQRDIDTAHALMRGIGLKEGDMIENPCIFDPSAEGCGFCDEIDAVSQKAAVEERWNEFPMSEEVVDLIDEFQARLGEGEAPAFGEIGDNVDEGNGYYSGGTSIASQIIEYLLMEMGGNVTWGWGEFSREDVYRFLEAHIYYREVQDRALPLNVRSHSYMSSEILSTLGGGAGGTRVLVGHDSELDALASIFGLEWLTPPFPRNATTPGSGIRFDLSSEGEVSVSLHYQAFDGTDDLLLADAAWTWSAGRDTVGIAELKEYVGGKLSDECMP